MKLYHAPGTCSLTQNILLREAGHGFSVVPVDLRTHKTADGGDFYAVNPKGYVPVLETDDGQRITENVAIASWIADTAPQANLLPPVGTPARYDALGWLAFVSTEVHKTYGPFFDPSTPDAVKEALRARLARRYAYLDAHLAGREYLAGSFGPADAYLYTVTRWAGGAKVDLAPYPNVQAFMARMDQRPSVQAALA